MKTAISIPEDLFRGLTQVANEEKTSRSKIIADAVREYIEKRRNQRLLLELNEAHQGKETEEEKQYRKHSRAHYFRRIATEKW